MLSSLPLNLAGITLSRMTAPPPPLYLLANVSAVVLRFIWCTCFTLIFILLRYHLFTARNVSYSAPLRVPSIPTNTTPTLNTSPLPTYSFSPYISSIQPSPTTSPLVTYVFTRTNWYVHSCCYARNKLMTSWTTVHCSK